MGMAVGACARAGLLGTQDPQAPSDACAMRDAEYYRLQA